MGLPRLLICACAVTLALAAPGAVPASDLQPDLQNLLAVEFRWSPSDLSELEAGRVVARGLPQGAPSEVGVLGAVRVDVRRQVFLERYRHIESFKRGPEVLQIGRFTLPPAPADLAPLTLTARDLDLRDCRVGNCDIRLPAETIVRFQHEINWSARGADAHAAAMFKDVLLDHVRAYLLGESGRIDEYADERRVVRPIEDFAGLIRNSPYLGRFVPGLAEHLLRFPAAVLEGAEDFLYWSKEKFGLGPFVTVTHVTIVPAGASGSVIASKDVYSSRYVDASLTLTVASDSVRTPGAFYLIYVNRSRASALQGPLASLRRSIVERRARTGLEEQLRTVKRRLEQGQ